MAVAGLIPCGIQRPRCGGGQISNWRLSWLVWRLGWTLSGGSWRLSNCSSCWQQRQLLKPGQALQQQGPQWRQLALSLRQLLQLGREQGKQQGKQQTVLCLQLWLSLMLDGGSGGAGWLTMLLNTCPMWVHCTAARSASAAAGLSCMATSFPRALCCSSRLYCRGRARHA